MNRRTVRTLLLAGLAGPCIFALSVIIGGELRAEYSHVDQFISELGESGAGYAWVMNLFGFMLSAGLILLFVSTLPTCLPRHSGALAGSVFLAIFAVSVFLAGIFSCDLGCPAVDRSREQELHDLVSIIAFPAFVLGVITWGVSFYRRADWRGFGLYSLATAAVSIIVLVAMIRSEAERDGTGAYQRLFLTLLFVWLMALAWRLRRDMDVEQPP